MKQEVAKKTKHGMAVLLVVIILIWGLSWPINKLALDFVPPLWFSASRLILATVVMFIIAVCLKKLILPTRKDLPLIFIMGLFQIGFFMLFINLGLFVEATGSAVLLVYTTPLWVMPIAVAFFKESSSVLKWIGFGLGMVGVLIMLSPWEVNWHSREALLAALFLVGASWAFSISILCARNMTWHHTPLELISWQLLVGTLLVLVIALIVQPHPVIHWNWISGGCVAYTGVMATALGFWGMAKLSKELPSGVIALGSLGVPLSGTLFSVALFHEHLDRLTTIAMVFILFGLVCVAWNQERKEKEEEKGVKT